MRSVSRNGTGLLIDHVFSLLTFFKEPVASTKNAALLVETGSNLRGQTLLSDLGVALTEGWGIILGRPAVQAGV